MRRDICMRLESLYRAADCIAEFRAGSDFDAFEKSELPPQCSGSEAGPIGEATVAGVRAPDGQPF